MPGRDQNPGSAPQAPQAAHHVLAENPGPGHKHQGVVGREMFEHGLQGRGQGIGQHRVLVGKRVRNGHQARGMGGRAFGHGPAGPAGVAQKRTRGQIPVQKPFAAVVMPFLAGPAGGQAPDRAGQPRFDHHPGAGRQVAARRVLGHRGHHLVAQNEGQAGIGFEQRGFQPLEQAEVRTADAAQPWRQGHPALGRIKGHRGQFQRGQGGEKTPGKEPGGGGAGQVARNAAPVDEGFHGNFLAGCAWNGLK